MPRPALLQITIGGVWNINLVVDLPTLLVGQITSLSKLEAVGGDFEVYILIVERGRSTSIVHTSQLRLDANLPQSFRIEVDSSIFLTTTKYQARAVIKNCKEEILFESAGSIDIYQGINVEVVLPVVLSNAQEFHGLQAHVNQVAPLTIGNWRLSVVGLNTVVNPEK